jgi:cytochrome c553
VGVLKIRILAIILGMLLVPALAQSAPESAELLRSINANAALKSDAISRGQTRSMLCGYCHGKDGNSVKEYIPNLAAQNPEYLLNQFQLFASGERKSYVMEQISKGLTSSEMVDLSVFFAGQIVKPQAHIQTSSEGMERYQGFCFACHGDDGKGNKDLPRLAGQKKVFLVKTLNDFKQGKAARANSPMVRIMKAVNASDIEPLANYIATMP